MLLCPRSEYGPVGERDLVEAWRRASVTKEAVVAAFPHSEWVPQLPLVAHHDPEALGGASSIKGAVAASFLPAECAPVGKSHVPETWERASMTKGVAMPLSLYFDHVPVAVGHHVVEYHLVEMKSGGIGYAWNRAVELQCAARAWTSQKSWSYDYECPC